MKPKFKKGDRVRDTNMYQLSRSREPVPGDTGVIVQIDLTEEVPLYRVRFGKIGDTPASEWFSENELERVDSDADEGATDTALHEELLGSDLEGPWPKEILEDLRIRARQLGIPESFIVRYSGLVQE